MTAPVFLGGLPRAGSTLLSGLLQQHPSIDVTPTGWALEALDGMRQGYSTSQQRAAWLDQEDAERRFLGAARGLLAGYGATVEKTRGAIPQRQLLRRVLGNDFRVIAPVRDLCGILASMERRYRQQPERHPGPAQGTTDGRVREWMGQGSAPLGQPAHALYEAVSQRDTAGILFIRYEDLLADPMGQLRAIYDWCGWTWRPEHHDPENVPTQTREHDAVHGLYGDHTLTSSAVRQRNDRPEDVLGEGLCQEVRQNNQWFYGTFYADAD